MLHTTWGASNLARLIRWTREDKIRALKAFAFFGGVTVIFWTCGGFSRFGQGKKDADARKPAVKKPFDVNGMIPGSMIPGSKGHSYFLGISSDHKVYAQVDYPGGTGGRSGLGLNPVVKIIDLETEDILPSPKWEPSWAFPHSAIFSQNAVAVVTMGVSREPTTVMIFSRKTGEVEQNYFARGEINDVAFTPDGRSLQIKVGGEIRSVDLK
jgi:hypothetical protein